MKCYFCNKSPIVRGKRKKLRAHYNPTGKKIQKPNLQWVKTLNGKRVKACVKCIKLMGKRN